jgi:hypothetical protein
MLVVAAEVAALRAAVLVQVAEGEAATLPQLGLRVPPVLKTQVVGAVVEGMRVAPAFMERAAQVAQVS